MTPDKRLDQVEPVLADVALKTDRLIESNGQIFDVATRADTNARIAAKGVADLTIEMRQQFGQQQNQIDQLRTEMNDRFEQVIIEQVELRKEMNLKFTQVAQTQEQILTLLLDRQK